METGTAVKSNQATNEAQVKPAPDKGLEAKEGGAEQKPEKTYRQSEVDALLGKAGQKLKADNESLTTERNTYKSQIESLTSEITEAKESIASLTKDIETMSADDPDKHALLKLRKEREAELKTLKAEKAEIEPVKAEMAKWKRDQLVYSVADEFVMTDGKSVDFDSFMASADKFKLKDREELEALAEEKGFKKKSEIPPEVPVKPYSGVTDGGGTKTDSQIIREYADNPNDQEKKKAWIALMQSRRKK